MCVYRSRKHRQRKVNKPGEGGGGRGKQYNWGGGGGGGGFPCDWPNTNGEGGGGGGKGAGVPIFTTGWLFLRRFHPALSSSSRGTSLLPARGCGGALQAPLSGSGALPQKLSLFMLQIPLKISRLPCEYMYMYHSRGGGRYFIVGGVKL